ncbi:MAG: hypothetical protein ACO3SO_10260 [Luteolibacter sp.]
MKSNSKTRFLLLLAGSSLLAVSSTQAAILAYEGFEAGGATPGAGQYETGTGYSGDKLIGQGPTTTGFTGTWGGSNDASFVYYQAMGAASSLNYSTTIQQLNTSDGSAQYTRITGTDTSGTRALFRTMSTPTPGDEAWFSVLLRYEGAGTWNSTFDLAVEQGGRNIGLGITAGGDLTAFAGGSGSFNQTVGALTEGVDHLVIVRMENNLPAIGGLDRISVWLDPTDLSSLGGANIVQEETNVYVGNNSSFQFDLLDINALIGNTGDSIYFDEFRLGDNLADVTPFITIPEPSAALLGGLGALLLLRRRRH